MSQSNVSGDELPLLDRAGVARESAFAHPHLCRRSVAAAGLIALVELTIIVPPAPRFVWNASASAPVGLYVVSPGATPTAGEIVVARMPASARYLAAVRGYVPDNVPLVKRVAAVTGDTVCTLGRRISINGRWIVERHVADDEGRALPWWNGCRALQNNEYFLLMADVPRSFDGRYFGITKRRDIVGKARLLWAW